jgi:hypothetical protein
MFSFPDRFREGIESGTPGLVGPAEVATKIMGSRVWRETEAGVDRAHLALAQIGEILEVAIVIPAGERLGEDLEPASFFIGLRDERREGRMTGEVFGIRNCGGSIVTELKLLTPGLPLGSKLLPRMIALLLEEAGSEEGENDENQEPEGDHPASQGLPRGCHARF